MTDQVVGRYILHEVIGRGAVGQVHRATERDSGQQVAVKVLRPELAGDPEIVGRFVRERSILAGVDHPFVVKVRDLVEDADTLAIVSDLVPGPNLRGYLAGATLAPAEATRLSIQVLEGLAAVHATGVVHRDVKPENVLVDTTAAPPQARLSDFGIARLTHGPSLTRLTGLIGTPRYLAPELSQREHATPAADVYSAGIMLYELVTGTTPFATIVDPVAVLLAAREKVPGPVPGFPQELWDICASMIAREPGDRPDAAAAARALSALAPSLDAVAALPRLERPPEPQVPEPDRATILPRSSHATPPLSGSRVGPDPPAAAGRRGRSRLVITAAIAAALVAGAFVAVVVNRTPQPPPHQSMMFPLTVVSGTVAAGRTWELAGTVLTGHVTLTNAGPATQTVTYDEVIPSVAHSARNLRDVQPAGAQVIQDDPVLRFVFPDVAPGQSRSLSYQATVPATGSLSLLAEDEVRAEAAYRVGRDLVVKQLRAISVTPGRVVLAVSATQDLVLAGTMNDQSPAPAAALAAAWSSSRSDIASVTSGTVRASRA